MHQLYFAEFSKSMSNVTALLLSIIIIARGLYGNIKLVQYSNGQIRNHAKDFVQQFTLNGLKMTTMTIYFLLQF